MEFRRRISRVTVIAAVVATSATSLATFSKAVEPVVSFTAMGPAGMKVLGTTPELDVAEEGDRVVISVRLDHLQTGIGLRDRHMKEKYLEVGQYPSARLSIQRSALRIVDGSSSGADVPATLTLHGKTRPVSVHYDAKKTGAEISVSGSFGVNMKDFGIAVPSYLGVAVKPDVEVAARFRTTGS